MKRPSRSAAIGLAAALGLTIAVIPGAVSAVGEEPPLPPAEPMAFIPGGTLTLAPSAGSVSFADEGSTNPRLTQSLGVPGSNCIEPPVGELLTFSGRSGNADRKVGYKGKWIGVNEEATVLCNLVDSVAAPGGGLEVLGLTLGSTLENPEERPLVATAASLTLAMNVRTLFTLSKPATVEVTAYLGGDQVGAPASLTNGAPGCATTYGAVCTLEFAPEGEFDRLELKAVKGAFGLQGATFDLVYEADKAFSCDSDNQPYTDASGATVLFVGNVSEGCTDFGVTLGDDPNAPGTKVFKKDLALNTDAQLIFTIPWATVQTDDPTVLPPATIDFEIGTEPRPMPFCPDYLFDSEGDLRGLFKGDDDYDDNLLDLKSLDMEVDVPSVLGSTGTQFACIGDRQAKATKADEEGFTLSIVDEIYVVGDARMRLG